MTGETARRVATVDELRSGPLRVTVDDRTFLVCEVDGEIRAFRNVCPHQHGPVVEGRIDADAEQVICPWHGWTFDLDTGRNPLVDASLSRVEAFVDAGDVYLDP